MATYEKQLRRSKDGTIVRYVGYNSKGVPEKFRLGYDMDGAKVKERLIRAMWERYLSYYGIRQAIRDGATLEVYYEPHYVPIAVDDQPLSMGFEEMCDEVELDDEEEKDFIQRKEAQWKKLVRDKRRVHTVIEHLVDHFLKHPDPSGFKAQLVTIDRKACAVYKELLDEELKKRGLPPEWSDVIMSDSQNNP